MSTSNWWMYHGDPEHSGYATGSAITSANAASLQLLHDITIPGPVLSVPAIVDGYVYVGLANSHDAPGANGGALLKISLQTGAVAARYDWHIDAADGDSHGFTGMGCTPAVTNGKVYFSTFDGKFYCLDQTTLKPVWVTDLRNRDLAQNQPVSNTMTDVAPGQLVPKAAGWSSPVVVMDAQGKTGSVYVGHGEGENPNLFGFVFCLDANTGKVKWIYCTVQFVEGTPNQPNVLPPGTLQGTPPAPFKAGPSNPPVRGCSVWSSIAYDATLNRLYCATGNPTPDTMLPSPGFSNGVLALDAATGAFKAFFQATPESSYRQSDVDVDVGGSPTLYTLNGRRVVAVGCKNGGLFVLDADTLELIVWRQLLPYYKNGDQIPTVDPHEDPADDPTGTAQNPDVPNATSDKYDAENYSGTYSTPAVDPASGLMFIGVGGNNYHNIAAGIDSATTPFMRAMHWDTLADAWAMDEGDPPRYVNAGPPDGPMYNTDLAGAESGLMAPAVVNDVVFCSTSKISVYAFASKTGQMLWEDQLGSQTGGMNGGYGYCMGPAVSGSYVVAGALVAGLKGGVLRIYALPSPKT